MHSPIILTGNVWEPNVRSVVLSLKASGEKPSCSLLGFPWLQRIFGIP